MKIRVVPTSISRENNKYYKQPVLFFGRLYHCNSAKNIPACGYFGVINRNLLKTRFQ